VCGKAQPGRIDTDACTITNPESHVDTVAVSDIRAQAHFEKQVGAVPESFFGWQDLDPNRGLN
jgi:hypothetical protein